MIAEAAISVGALGGVVSMVLWASTHSRATLWGPVVWHGPTDIAKKQIALTFDDGPTPQTTEKVLEALAEVQAKATFFVIGKSVEQYPDILRQVHAHGHLIANHTFDHSHYMFLKSKRYWREQIEKTNNAVERVVGYRPTYFRSPMGVRTHRASRPVREAGQTFVTWTRRALDGLPTTADEICDRLIPNSLPGDILVLHDGVEPGYSRNPMATVAAIPRIIAALRTREIEPVRLDELLRTNNDILDVHVKDSKSIQALDLQGLDRRLTFKEQR